MTTDHIQDDAGLTWSPIDHSAADDALLDRLHNLDNLAGEVFGWAAREVDRGYQDAAHSAQPRLRK